MILKWNELNRKQEELRHKLSQVERGLDNYPRAGDLIKHKMDHTFSNPEGFVTLTPEKWVVIERDNDWGHYEVLRNIR